MNRRLKSFLQTVNLYHPLQTSYRSGLSFFTSLYYRISYARYKGKGFVCNFCGAVYERFVPEYPGRDIECAIYSNNVIAGFGENVYCPHCRSKNRDRLVKAVIDDYLDIDHKKILHFSPEAQLSRYLAKKADITSVDITPGFYRHVDKAVTYADATSLPFEDSTFDVVIANHILEHIPEDRKAMMEIYRVLKPEGAAILQVPFSATLAATIEQPFLDDPLRQAALFGQKDHVRIYALKDYTTRLEKTGFQVQVLDPETLARFRGHAIQLLESVFLGYKK